MYIGKCTCNLRDRHRCLYYLGCSISYHETNIQNSELGKISKLRSFGETLHHGLQNAKFDTNNNNAMWVEEDYCSPPLAMERESVLDRYFDDITVERVSSEEKGWRSLEDKPLLWNQ